MRAVSYPGFVDVVSNEITQTLLEFLHQKYREDHLPHTWNVASFVGFADKMLSASTVTTQRNSSGEMEIVVDGKTVSLRRGSNRPKSLGVAGEPAAIGVGGGAKIQSPIARDR